MSKTVKYIDLFAGMGGIRLGYSNGVKKLRNLLGMCFFF